MLCGRPLCVYVCVCVFFLNLLNVFVCVVCVCV